MSLPRCLNMSLSKFVDKQSSEIVRVYPNSKRSFANGETITFSLPASGVVDLYSITYWFELMATASATATATAVGFNSSWLFSKVEIRQQNGGTLWGNLCQSFSEAFTILRRLTVGEYTLATSTLYEDTSLTTPATAGANNATRTWCALNDLMPMIFKNCRFLPMAAVGAIDIVFTLDIHNRLNVPTNITYSINDCYISMKKVNFQDSLLDTLVAAKLQQGPIELAITNFADSKGPAAAGTISYPFSFSSGSIDLVCCTVKPSTATSATYHVYPCPTNVQAQLLVNGTPTGYPMGSNDVYYSVMNAIDANFNLLADPSWSTTSAFTFAHNFSLPSSRDENLVSGMNTYGSPAQFTMLWTTTDATQYIPYYVVYCTSILELSGGRQVRVLQ